MSILLVGISALLIALPASAQVNLGVIGGPNLANLSLDPEPEDGVDLFDRTVFGIGVVLNFGLGQTLALQLEPMYLQKGANASAEGFTGLGVKISYIEVPAMLKFAFGTSDTKLYVPYVMAGPTVGYLLSAKQDVPGVGEQDITDTVKDIDFGVAFGGGMSFPAGNKTVFVEVRYSLGLTDINDDADNPTKIKTKGIQIMAGITFIKGDALK